MHENRAHVNIEDTLHVNQGMWKWHLVVPVGTVMTRRDIELILILMHGSILRRSPFQYTVAISFCLGDPNLNPAFVTIAPWEGVSRDRKVYISYF